ncbi:MAG: hypothetical protein KAU47_01375 [Candidatus Aminicenantes bacterium]|nr:hypothetical protein [Candidatus Aminicenantes bacterium]
MELVGRPHEMTDILREARESRVDEVCVGRLELTLGKYRSEQSTHLRRLRTELKANVAWIAIGTDVMKGLDLFDTR